MGQDEKRRQKSLQKRAARHKQKKLHVRRTGELSSRALLQVAAAWPVRECLISRDWKSGHELVQVIIARQSPAGDLVAGVFLVDLCCLGVKSAFATRLLSLAEFERLWQSIAATQPLVDAELNLAAKIIREGLAYARQLGFDPDPDYRNASVLLAGAEPDACDAQISLGKDGKPFYVAGPRDNARKIVAQLGRAVGPGNFDFIVPLGAQPDR